MNEREAMILREKIAGYRAFGKLHDDEMRGYSFEERWEQIKAIQRRAATFEIKFRPNDSVPVQERWNKLRRGYGR